MCFTSISVLYNCKWKDFRFKKPLAPVNSRFAYFTWFGWGGILNRNSSHVFTKIISFMKKKVLSTYHFRNICLT